METTGNVFNPDYYMIDEVTDIVYRKEQFTEGSELPLQLLVRDRRYRRPDIEAMCMKAGFDIVWSRYVRLYRAISFHPRAMGNRTSV